jgi:hypothetical protein
MSMNLKEMHMFCEKVFPEYTKEKWQNCCYNMKKFYRNINNEMAKWMKQSTARLFTKERKFGLYEYR